MPQNHDQHEFESQTADTGECLARPAMEAFECLVHDERPAGFHSLFFLSIAASKFSNHRKFHGFLLNLMAVARPLRTQQVTVFP